MSLLLALLTQLALAVPHIDPPSLLYEWHISRDELPQASLRALHVARFTVPASLMVDGDPHSDRVTVPVTAYLYQHHTHGLVLIDPAFGERTQQDPDDLPGERFARRHGLVMGATARDQILAAGLDPNDVHHIIVTHLHADHAAAIEDFPNATLWVAEAEWKRAQRRHGPYRPSAYAKHGDVQTIRFNAANNLQPYGAFEDHVDLFGDGGLILLPTPGPTPGHLSVLVNLYGGSYLITGDVAWRDANWQQPAPKGMWYRTFHEDNWAECVRSGYRIRDWTQRYPELHILAAHEPENLNRLPPFPDTMR